MRIGIFSDYYLARGDGTAEASRLSRRGLMQHGHKVKVFCPLIKNYPLQPGVMAPPSLPGWLYPGLRLCWPFRKKYIKQAAGLDMVHMETPIIMGMFGCLVARKYQTPSVITVHLDMDFMGSYGIRLPALAAMVLAWACISGCFDKMFWRVFWPRRVDRSKRRTEDFAWRAMAYVAGCCDRQIVPSQKNYDQLVKYLPPTNLRLVPNGVNIKKSQNQSTARQKLGLAKADFIVISTARLVREKRVDMVVAGFARTARSEARAKLLILNDGPERPKLIRLAKKLNVDEQVIFVGLVDQAKLRSYLAAADVFVNVCLREVASLGVLEAAASGLPLLLTDRRLSEPLADSLNGFWVNGAHQIARRLAQLSHDTKLAAKLGQASYKRVSKFSVEAHAKELITVYSELTRRG